MGNCICKPKKRRSRVDTELDSIQQTQETTRNCTEKTEKGETKGNFQKKIPSEKNIDYNLPRNTADKSCQTDKDLLLAALEELKQEIQAEKEETKFKEEEGKEQKSLESLTMSSISDENQAEISESSESPSISRLKKSVIDISRFETKMTKLNSISALDYPEHTSTHFLRNLNNSSIRFKIPSMQLKRKMPKNEELNTNEDKRKESFIEIMKFGESGYLSYKQLNPRESSLKVMERLNFGNRNSRKDPKQKINIRPVPKNKG